ncbi:MAG: glycosyltransferase [Anaerolineales bacterium]
MKIIVPAMGSRGDVQPYINLCQGLQKAGHEAVLASLPCMRRLAEEHGVSFAAIGPDVDLTAETARMWEGAARFWWIGMMRVMRLGARLIEQAFPDLLELCRGADLIVVSDASAGAAEGDKLGIPWVSVTLQPLRVPVVKERNNGPMGMVRDAVWGALGRMMAAPINGFRKRVGAPPVDSLAATGIQSEDLLLLPASPNVVSPDPVWAPFVEMTGYWFPEEDPDWRPPGELADFLAAGEPPIVVCLGAMSMSGENARRAAGITLQAVRKSGVRAVVQGWEFLVDQEDMPPGAFRAGPLPHGWLLERAAGIVHHGGAGTTATGFRSGKPALVIPHIIDQYYWSQRVEALGCGPQPIPRPQLTVNRMAAGMRSILEDDGMRARAAEVGRSVRAEGNGVERAVRLIETSAEKEHQC